MKQKLLFIFFIITIQLFSQTKNQSTGFKENKGQIIDQKGKSNTAVLYLLNSNGLNVQLRKNGFSYDVYEVKKTVIAPSKDPRNEREFSSHFGNNKKDQEPEYNLEYTFHRIDIDFVNSNSKVQLVAEQKSIDFDNYYNVPNKPEGITGVYQYKQVTYKNIYSNIDVVFTIPADPQKIVEYNFVIHPKGKISDIQLKFNGAETDLIDNKIQMNVRFGKMEETLPASWIEDGGNKKEITVGYTTIKKDIYGFSSSNNVNGKTIVIDPVPIRLWGTYYGNINFTDEPNSINFDHVGNTIFTGKSESTTGIATTGAFQSTATAVASAFMAKLDSNGVRVWGTYLGRSGIQSAKINLQNEIYIGGYADADPSSTLVLATPNSFKETIDFVDVLLMKFDSNGQRIWGTYFGGQNFERLDAISLDSQENIIIAGETTSVQGIATPSAYQSTLIRSSTPYSGFFAKFDKNGNRLYGSYFPFIINSSIIDSNGNIIFTGNQYISDIYTLPNISTSGAFKTTHNSNDGFIIKFSPDFTKLWCTYYGGDKTSVDQSENSDLINGVGTDGANNIYIVGTTTSSNNMSTSGAFKISQNAGEQDAFIAKFDTNGNRIWGTYFGSDSKLYIDSGSNCFITPEGNIYLIGSTDSPNNIATVNSFQTVVNGLDSYIAKFSTNGELNWSTYYGGKGGDYLKSIDFLNGKIAISGRTVYDDSSYFSTPGTHKINGGGFIDIFVASFQDCELVTTVKSNSPVCIGKTLELKASGGTNYLWTGPNGFTSTDQNLTISNATANNSGEYSCLITGTGGCDDTKKITVVVGDIEKPIPDLATLPTITGNCQTTINTIPTATDACAGAIIGTTTNPLSYNLPGTYTIVWNYNDGNGNIATQNQTVVITSPSVPNFASTQFFCERAHPIPTNNTGEGPGDLKWYISPTSTSPLSDTDFLEDGITYYVSRTSNGCESTRVPITIRIRATYPPTGNANQRFCSGFNPTLNNIVLNGTNIRWYDALTNGNVLPSTTNLQNGKTYYASQAPNVCESERFAVTVSVQNSPAKPTGDINPKFCKSEKATLSNIHINEQNLTWYESESAVIPLANNTLVQNNTTYYVAQLSGCESERLAVLVTVSDSPVPIVNSTQQFCIDENATISNINITGNNIKWYDLEVNGIVLPETTPLQNKVYYATQTLNNCESERFTVTVKVQDTQNPIVTSPQIFCIQQKAKIGDIEVSGQNIKWFESQTSNISLSESALLENGITYYVQETINNCESDKIPVKITILEATSGNCINLVEELPFPKFFTPNNDGYNDTWTINFAYLAPNSSIRIFDRYGKFIKELTLNTAWDGTYIGTNEPSSDYWFVVTRLNGVEFKSHFSLKR